MGAICRTSCCSCWPSGSSGWRSAEWRPCAAYVSGAATVLGLVLIQPGGVQALERSDLIRFGAFVFGAPALVYLVNRAEMAREIAGQALAASRAAEQRLEAERRRIEASGEALERARAEAERDRARLEEVAEAIPEPLIVYDSEPRGTYGNRAALRLFGRSFVERPIDEWGRSTEPRGEDGRLLARDEWPQVVAQSASVRRRIVMRIPMSGRDVIVDVEGTPIPGGGAVLLLRDVGKEEDERRRLSRFASFVAHELRNPLAVAKARTELAQRDPNLPPRARNHGLRALESVDAAIGILERLELYSRADSGTRRGDPRAVRARAGPRLGDRAPPHARIGAGGARRAARRASRSSATAR